MPKCKLCGQDFRLITSSHLKYKHNITTLDYMCMLPGLPMRDENFVRNEEARKRSISESWENKSPQERAKISQRQSEAQIGKKLSEETKKRISEGSSKRQSDIGYRLRHSRIMSPILEEMWKRPEYRKIKIEQLTKSNRKNWDDPNYRKKTLEAQHRMPSSDERLITSILDRNFPHQWEYTGNKSFIGGGRKSPDWTHTSLKKVIEYDGAFWHSGYFREEDTKGKIRHYANLGYDCLIITDSDLWLNPAGFIQMIKEFSEKEDLNGSSAT